MKAFLLAALLLISTPLMALDSCLSGSWYTPDRVGEGITLEIAENQVVGYFYTYGSAERAWYVLAGDNDNNILTMYGTSKISEKPFAVFQSKVGTAVVTEIDSDNINFSFDIVLDIDDANPWCLSGFCKGAYKYTRLTQPIPCE